MKSLLACTGLLIASHLSAQTRTQAPAQEPAATETATIAGKTITITYSSPGVKGRAGKLFTKDGQIGHDPTYPVWRAGANAATSCTPTAISPLAAWPFPRATTPSTSTSPTPTIGPSSSTPRPASGAPSMTRQRTWAAYR
jgi:hypothetical protein